jgi:hypothetical protein
MWQWIGIGVVSYLILMSLVFVIASAARVADRRERAVFAAWMDERSRKVDEDPALRRGERRRAA